MQKPATFSYFISLVITVNPEDFTMLKTALSSSLASTPTFLYARSEARQCSNADIICNFPHCKERDQFFAKKIAGKALRNNL